MSKQIFLDLETTGFSRQWDYIIEIAAIIVENNEIIDHFHEYIKPGKKIPLEVVNLTGITNEQVSGCRSEKEVLMDFSEWVAIVNPDEIIGHNCKSFDLGFIREKSMKYGYSWKEPVVTDTLQIARELNKCGKIKTENNKQPTLAAYFGIDYEAHSAIEDVRALISIYNKMLQLKQPPTRASLGF